jgi:uncharacterized protein YrrD
MLWNASSIRGYEVVATDGHSGTVEDFIFEDRGWTIRWLVVETGTWLAHRRVYVPVAAAGEPDAKSRRICLSLTLDQIGQCPSGDVTLLRDAATGAHFTQGEPQLGPDNHVGPHFRSLIVMTDASVEAIDDDVGHVQDFLIDADQWRVNYLLVHTTEWWIGEVILISVKAIAGIDYTRNILKLNVNRQVFKDSERFSPEQTVDGAYDETFLTYFGIRFVEK